MILIGKEPSELEQQINRRDQEQIVALRLLKMGLKVSFGVANRYVLFWFSCGILAIS